MQKCAYTVSDKAHQVAQVLEHGTGCISEVGHQPAWSRHQHVHTAAAMSLSPS